MNCNFKYYGSNRKFKIFILASEAVLINLLKNLKVQNNCIIVNKLEVWQIQLLGNHCMRDRNL